MGKPSTRKPLKTADKRSYLSIKLSLISIVILSVVVSFYVYVSYQDMIAAIDGQYKERAESAISMVKTELATSDDIENTEYLQWACDRFSKSYPNIVSITIGTRRSGKLMAVASNNRSRIGKTIEIGSIPLKSGDISWKERSTPKEGHIVEIASPVYIDGMLQAVINVRMNLKSKDMAIKQYMLRTLAYVFLGLLALTPILYARFRREVYAPVSLLIEGAQEVAQGNLDKRVNLERKDELGKLSQEFDHMTETIQQREEETLRELEKIKEKWNEAETKSRTDFLTDLENPRSFHTRLEAELNRASRAGAPVTLLFCDLDRFKDFNDANGHLLGDRALFDTAEIIKFSIRNYDIAARYGGEEFAVILPNTDTDNAQIVAERIRHNIELYGFATIDGFGMLTVSIGIATFPGDAADKDTLIAAADHAMYESKRRGRNCVTTFKPSISFNPQKAS